MTDTAIASYLAALDAAARAASAAEIEHQKQAARRAAALRGERAFAWRRLNLMRAAARAVSGADTPEAVAEAGRAVVHAEAGWSGGSEAQREVAERFVPVAEAIAAAAAGGEADPVAALAEFEAWYAEARHAPFLALMEREVVELPLVEV